ncbi:FCD domain-containing protein [Pararhizobium mangrovi]|uniref:FCD domain-containing protein n=2 Tax=Pararhizobium mangrovi TaxID=2590452 RepID=A0A506U7I5_9HYPH|nr:FCD domain-containing protein [Pararhizobium mangrovi]
MVTEAGFDVAGSVETLQVARRITVDEGETLTQAAFRSLRDDIIRGVRAPGERLRIERLKQIYAIGPTPIREALQRLSSERLVIAEGNRGFTVAPLDYGEFTDLNVARTDVELAALRRSIENGDDAWEAGVVAASHIMKKEDAAVAAGSDGVPDSWEKANVDFHTALVAACGSDWLLHIRAGLQDMCERYRRASVSRVREERRLGAEHQEIFEAVIARQTERACTLIREHFELTARNLSVGGAGRRDG